MSIFNDDISNESFTLKKPDESYADQIRAYRDIFLRKHSSMDGTSFLEKYDDPIEWIRLQQSLSNDQTVPEGLVPGDEYLYIRDSDNKLVGMINIRHRLNEYLSLYGGHIGYSVLPAERRKGIATRMLKDALPLCRKLGINPVFITCHQGNIGSRNVILANNGIYEGDISDGRAIYERYWIDLNGD